MLKLRRAVVKEEYVAITKNDSMALILNQLIYWSNKTRDSKKFIQEEQKRSITGKSNYNYGWIYKSYSELKHELMTTNSVKTIGRNLSKLIELGFIDRKKNEKYKYDKKYLYRVNILNIIKKLNEHGYEMLDYKFEFQNVVSEKQKDITNCQTDPPNGQSDVAIAKITKKIIIENINTTTAENGVVVNLERINLNEIIDTFKTVTLHYPNERDMKIINEILKLPVEIEANQKIEAIIKILKKVGREFKERTPDDTINSFNYFKKAILAEFKILEQQCKGGDLRIDRAKDSKSKQEYDLNSLYTNK